MGNWTNVTLFREGKWNTSAEWLKYLRILRVTVSTKQNTLSIKENSSIWAAHGWIEWKTQKHYYRPEAAHRVTQARSVSHGHGDTEAGAVDGRADCYRPHQHYQCSSWARLAAGLGRAERSLYGNHQDQCRPRGQTTHIFCIIYLWMQGIVFFED